MWGQDALGCLVKQRSRIIPTRVGTSGDNTSLCNLTKDHPHACGDKHFQANVSKVKPGSSPRVWGQVSNVVGGILGIRIIPTRVGTRSVVRPKAVQPQDHPHACGDKLPNNLVLYRAKGSSPRVWGQAAFASHFKGGAGIIPTRVGTSPYTSESFGGYRDHPHACGDKSLRPNNFQSCRGSSPRVWGQGFRGMLKLVGEGIIPTRVGTSRLQKPHLRQGMDHPHACGDKRLQASSTAISLGSSPRVWGQDFFG